MWLVTHGRLLINSTKKAMSIGYGMSFFLWRSRGDNSSYSKGLPFCSKYMDVDSSYKQEECVFHE